MPKKEKPEILLITGVPSTGKTTLSLDWCKLNGWAYLSLNDIVEEKSLYSGIDIEDMAKLVKLHELEDAVNEWIDGQEGPAIIEGHLGCEIRLKVSEVLVLRLNPSEIAKRLEARGYTPAKVSSNKMAELLDYCVIRSLKNYKAGKVFELDVSGKDKAQSLDALTEFLVSVSKKEFRPHVSWSDALLKEVNAPV